MKKEVKLNNFATKFLALSMSTALLLPVFPGTSFAAESQQEVSNSTYSVQLNELETFEISKERLEELEKLEQIAEANGTVNNAIKGNNHFNSIAPALADVFPWPFTYEFKIGLESRPFTIPSGAKHVQIATNSRVDKTTVADSFSIKLFRGNSYIGQAIMSRKGPDSATFTNVGPGTYTMIFGKAQDGATVTGSGSVSPGY